MPYKRVVTEEEINALAEQLRPLWRPGDVIRPWLRRHSAMLLDLVRGDWSWSAIASAMTRAGITYRTGKPWTADWLQSDFYRARTPLKGHARRQRLAPEPEAQAIGLRPSPQTAACDPDGQAPSPASESLSDRTSKLQPRFKPASFKPAETRPPQSDDETAEIERNRILTFGRS
jgi:hypothetical protein